MYAIKLSCDVLLALSDRACGIQCHVAWIRPTISLPARPRSARPHYVDVRHSYRHRCNEVHVTGAPYRRGLCAG